MRRGRPLRRRSELERGGRLRARSPKRVVRDRDEAAVKRYVLARDGGCVLRGVQGDEYRVRDGVGLDLSGPVVVPACGGPLDKHETIPRSLWPDGCLDPTNCATLCRAHHDWIESTTWTREWARGRGLLRGSADRPR